MTMAPLLDELAQRRSTRAFADRPIEPEKLTALWEAARWAPSSSNRQDWRYYAFIGPARERLAPVLVEGNHWALKAGLLLAVARDASIDNAFDGREYGAYDVALSVMCLCLEAQHQGLWTHQMAGFLGGPCREVTGMPDHEEPVVVVAVGYMGDVERLPEKLQRRERAPRERQPLGDMLTVVDA